MNITGPFNYERQKRTTLDQTYLGQVCVWLLSRMMIGLPDIAIGNIVAKQAFWRWESISMPLPFHPPEHPPKDNGIGPSFTLIEGSNHNTSTNLKL